MLARIFQINSTVLVSISLLSLKINKGLYNFYKENKSSKSANQLIVLLSMGFIIIAKYLLVLLQIQRLCYSMVRQILRLILVVGFIMRKNHRQVGFAMLTISYWRYFSCFLFIPESFILTLMSIMVMAWKRLFICRIES